MPVSSSETEIRNDGDNALEVWLEPWGHPISISPGKSVLVVATSQKEGSLEVVRENGIVAVYGWSKSSVSVFEDGILVDELFELPDLGDGPSARQVVELLFGGPGGPR